MMSPKEGEPRKSENINPLTVFQKNTRRWNLQLSMKVTSRKKSVLEINKNQPRKTESVRGTRTGQNSKA